LRIILSSLCTYAAIAAFSTLTINQQPVEAKSKSEVHRFICSSGTADFFQDASNASLGFGRRSWFLRCITPDFAGSTVGLDIHCLDFSSSFENIDIVFQDDGSTVSNMTALFCFRSRIDGSTISVEKPFSTFRITKIPNTRFSEGFVAKSDFSNPAISRGNAVLSRVAMLVKSGGKQHTIVFGRTFIETSLSDSDPSDIFMADEGCSGAEPCLPSIIDPPPGHNHPHGD